MTAKVILLHYMFIEITQDKTQPKYLHTKNDRKYLHIPTQIVVEITQDKTQPKNQGSHDACNVNKLKSLN